MHDGSEAKYSVEIQPLIILVAQISIHHSDLR